MKDILIAQGWNLALAATVILLGWYFPYEVGAILESPFNTSGHWIDATAGVGIIFGVPFFVTIFLSAFGRRWWYWWVVVIFLPTSWLIISSGDFSDWTFLIILILVPLSIGLGTRMLLKRFIPGFPLQ